MHVHEIAKAAGVTAETVRYYTRVGLFSPDRDESNGYRCYGADDLRRLKFIRNARHLGFTVKDVAEILQHAESGSSPCPFVREKIVKRMADIEEHRRVEAALVARMTAATDAWKHMPDGIPDGESICHLIEAVSDGP